MSKKDDKYYSPLIAKLLDERDPRQTEKVRKRMLLAAKIEDGIKAKGWKKKEFADALNKQPSEISKWLSGVHNFTFDTLLDIEDVLRIELISLSKKKHEQITNYYIAVSQPTGKKPSNCDFYMDPDDLIHTFSLSAEV